MAHSNGAGLVPASTIPESRVQWLLQGWIPLGGISLLAGVPGVGKSLWTVHTVASLSRGALTGTPERSLIVTAEDSLSAVVVPRLRIAGADMDLALLPVLDKEPPLWLPDATERLQSWVQQHGVKLVVVDPLTAFLPNRTVNTWQDSSVRSALKPLATLADQMQIAIVAVLHLNKGGSSDPLHRVGGSIGFPAAARSVLVLANDPSYPDSDRRVLAHAKSNFGPLSPSISLAIQPGEDGNAAQIVEIGTSRYTACELLSDPESPSRLDEAIDFLTAELARGPRRVTELAATASAVGISEATLRRARQRLGVRSSKSGFDHWNWELPQTNTEGTP